MKHYIYCIVVCCFISIIGAYCNMPSKHSIFSNPFIEEPDTLRMLDLTNDYIMDMTGSGSEVSSIFGDDFTPRGEFKILMIFVTFDNPNEPEPMNDLDWPAPYNLVPWWYVGNEFIYKDLSEFDNIWQDDRSISHYLYKMSEHLPPSERLKLYSGHLETFKPLANKEEPFNWMMETIIAPWVIYVLKK